MTQEEFPISEEIKRQQEHQQQASSRRRTRHNSLSPVCQDRFERRFSEIDKNNDGLIDQGEIQKELQSRQQTIPYKEIKINEPTVNNTRIAPKNGFKDGIFIRKKSEAVAKQAQEIIAVSDKDGDGKITEADFVDLMHENQKRGNEYFDLLDTDADGILTIQDIITHPDLAELNLSKALGIIRKKLPHFYLSHLQNDDFSITKREFIERHIDELILFESSDRRTQRDARVFDFREMNSYTDYEAAPVDKAFQWHTFAMGAIAGATSRTATAPVDRLKIFFQVHHQSPEAGYIKTLRFMVREGGLKSLWRGNAVNVAKIMPEQALKYGVFEAAKNKWGKDNITGYERFMAGALAGATSQTLIYPFEVVKTRMVLRATGQYSGVVDCVKQLYQLEGQRAFFQGYAPTVIGIVPYCGLDLLFAESAKMYLEKSAKARWTLTEDGSLKWYVPFAIGGGSSATAGIICYPFNLVKTKMQAMRPKDFAELGSPKEHCKPRATQIVSEVWRVHGPRGLYSGLQANLLKGVLASSISWGMWENLKSFFNYRGK